MIDNPDRFIVRGFGSADGEYAFDWFGVLNVGTTEALDLREQHRITQSSGIKPAEYLDAFTGLHPGFLVAFSSVLFARQGKNVTEERIWNSRITYCDLDEIARVDGEKNVIVFAISARNEEEAEESPPEMAPPTSRKLSENGGADSSLSSGRLDGDPSRTGARLSEMLTPVQGSPSATSGG